MIPPEFDYYFYPKNFDLRAKIPDGIRLVLSLISVIVQSKHLAKMVLAMIFWHPMRLPPTTIHAHNIPESLITQKKKNVHQKQPRRMKSKRLLLEDVRNADISHSQLTVCGFFSISSSLLNSVTCDAVVDLSNGQPFLRQATWPEIFINKKNRSNNSGTYN